MLIAQPGAWLGPARLARAPRICALPGSLEPLCYHLTVAEQRLRLWPRALRGPPAPLPTAARGMGGRRRAQLSLEPKWLRGNTTTPKQSSAGWLEPPAQWAPSAPAHTLRIILDSDKMSPLRLANRQAASRTKRSPCAISRVRPHVRLAPSDLRLHVDRVLVRRPLRTRAPCSCTHAMCPAKRRKRRRHLAVHQRETSRQYAGLTESTRRARTRCTRPQHRAARTVPW